jgi:protein required for attachment to host cells
MRKVDTWVLLADAERARVLRYPERTADMAATPLDTVFETATTHLPGREIMADAPGRGFASTGARRSSMEPRSDPVRDQTRRFAEAILAQLEERLARKEFAQLMIFAPPRMLGDLRDAMSEQMAATVVSQTPKDLTKLPELALRETLAQRE